jgi:ABC-2 type transport system permease protein
MRPYSKYMKSFALGAQSAMEYRADFLLGMVSAAWPIFIQFFLWKSIYAGAGSESLFGYTYAQMVAYVIIANIVQRLIRTGFEYEMNDDIKNGGLDKYIVKPVGYFQYRMAAFVGSKSAQSLVIFAVMIGAVVILNAVYGDVVAPLNALYFAASLALAFVLNFIVFFFVGMLAFWLTEIGFFFEAVRIVFIALSGGIFPLSVFGEKFASAMDFLPFKYTVNFPVDVLSGRVSGQGIWMGCLIQLGWIALLSFLAVRVWNRAQRRYVAAGG